MYYLTVYKHLHNTFFGREEFKGDKVTLVLNTLFEYHPSEAIEKAITDGYGLNYWHQDRAIDADMKKNYRQWTIAKRDGGERLIKEPVGNLKLIQRNICYKMKAELKILPHDCCHGFVKHRRCLSAMQKHQDNQSMWFLKLDIHNFFPSISADLIHHTFMMIPQTALLPYYVRRTIVSYLVDETGHLTQGCVSSPYIANLVLLDFDYKFSEYCRNNNLTYTRYADDMCISSRVQIDVKDVVDTVKSLLPSGIHLNYEKTKYTNINKENVFLGIHYNQDKQLTVGRETKHLMKVIAHKAQLGQLPVTEHSLWKGRLIYYSSIEPEYFKNERFDSIRNL